jgi:hypothetical protein
LDKPKWRYPFLHHPVHLTARRSFGLALGVVSSDAEFKLRDASLQANQVLLELCFFLL